MLFFMCVHVQMLLSEILYVFGGERRSFRLIGIIINNEMKYLQLVCKFKTVEQKYNKKTFTNIIMFAKLQLLFFFLIITKTKTLKLHL